MKLKQMRIWNFRSLQKVIIPFQPDLTVLIGENDSGKSSVLDLLEWILEAPYLSPSRIARPSEADFTIFQSGPADKIMVRLDFDTSGETKSGVPDRWVKDEGQKKVLRLRVTYSRDGDPCFEIRELQFKVPEVGMSASALKQKRKEQLDDVLQKLGLEPTQYATKDDKIKAITSAGGSAPMQWRWKEVQPKDLRFLPRIQRYRALEYKEPEKYLEKTLKAVFADALHSRSRRNQGEALAAVRHLQARAQSQLETEVQQLKNFIQSFLPNVKRISYNPDVRFEEALRGGELLIDTGFGPHPLSLMGDGTKRRMVMAAMEWEREVLRRIGNTTPVLRAYDEPDTNLHYNAQRQFFKAVRNTLDENPSQQAILCTHSLFMIDAAPARSIVHLRRGGKGITQIETLPVDQDKDREIALFLENVAAQLGVTNSVFFFDRCYLLVEGETEYFALPILYRALYGRSLSEDGIALINLKGAKSAASLFRLLGERRAQLVIFLLDTDVAGKKRTQLQNQGWSDEQIDKCIISIGEREFEDIFTDEVWAKVCEKNWPRQDGKWDSGMIKNVREGNDTINTGKFSEDLKNVIQRDAGVKGGLGKPEMGQKLAEYLGREENLSLVPSEIQGVFKQARQIAGVEG